MQRFDLDQKVSVPSYSWELEHKWVYQRLIAGFWDEWSSISTIAMDRFGASPRLRGCAQYPRGTRNKNN